MKDCAFETKLYNGIRIKKILRLYYVSVWLLLFFGVFVQPAYAHKVNIFAYAEDGKIHAEGYFMDGSKCRNSLVHVIDEKTGEQLLEGRTDDHGQFIFDIPRMTSIKLILYAGTGHQNEYILKEEEVKEALPQKQVKQKTNRTVKQADTTSVKRPNTVPEPKARHRQESTVSPHGTNATNTDSYDIDAAIERAIDKKLQPVMKILLNLQEKSENPGLTEIMGGIGYIIGILGIIAYFKGRAKKP